MPLEPHELRLITEARDLARQAVQTLDETVVPALYGNGEPGLLERVRDLEDERTEGRGRATALTWIGRIVLFLLIAFLGGVSASVSPF